MGGRQSFEGDIPIGSTGEKREAMHSQILSQHLFAWPPQPNPSTVEIRAPIPMAILLIHVQNLGWLSITSEDLKTTAKGGAERVAKYTFSYPLQATHCYHASLGNEIWYEPLGLRWRAT